VVYLWIAFGSALGGAARYWCYGFAARVWGETFPWGTLAVNVIGCAFIGLFATLTGPDGKWLAPSSLRMFVMTGICGGYTTFSTFSLETLNLAHDGEWYKAGANIAASIALCLIGVWLGHSLANVINQR
jgi:CrcB protein